MTTPASQTSGFRPLHWILIVCAAGMLVIAVKIAGIFFLSREASDLQSALTDAAGRDTDTHIQFTIGPGLLSVARLATTWIDDIPDEARRGLAAVRRVSVGIYQLDGKLSGSDRVTMLEAADRKLGDRGWERVVAVANGKETVLIYTPKGWEKTDEIRFCVAVQDGRDLVVVSAQAETAPLMELVRYHLPDRHAI